MSSKSSSGKSQRFNLHCSKDEFDKLNILAQKHNLTLSRYLVESGLADNVPISPQLRNNVEQIKYELSLLEHHFSLLRKKAHFQQLAQSGELKLLIFYLTASAKYLHDVFFPNSSFDPNSFSLTDNQHSKSSVDGLHSVENLQDANDDVEHGGLQDDLNKNNFPTNSLDFDSSNLSPLLPLSILTQFPTNHFPFVVSYSCASSIVDVGASNNGKVNELNQIDVEQNVVDVVEQSAIEQTESSLSEINQNQINQNVILDSGASVIVSAINDIEQNVAQQNTIEQNVVENNLIENNTFQQNFLEQTVTHFNQQDISVLPDDNFSSVDTHKDISSLERFHLLPSVDLQTTDLQVDDLQSTSLPLPLAHSTHSSNELINNELINNNNSLINDVTLTISDPLAISDKNIDDNQIDNLIIGNFSVVDNTSVDDSLFINDSPLVDDLSDLPIDDRLVEQKIIQMLSHEFNIPISSLYSSIKELHQSLKELNQDSDSNNISDDYIEDDPDEPYYDDPDIDKLEASVNCFFDHVYSSIRSDIAKSKAYEKAYEVDISNISTSKSPSNASLSNNSLANNSLPIASLATSSLLASQHSIAQQQDSHHLDNHPIDNFHLDSNHLDNSHLDINLLGNHHLDSDCSIVSDISPGHVLSPSSNTTSQSSNTVSGHGCCDSAVFDDTGENCSLINKCNLPSIAPAVFFCDVNHISILDNGDILIPKELFDSFSHLSPSLLRQQLLSSASTIDGCMQTHSTHSSSEGHNHSNSDKINLSDDGNINIFSGDSDILSGDSDISSKEAP